MGETQTERLEREHGANIDVLERLMRALPDSAVRHLVNIPAVKAKYQELEKEANNG
ncbi:hypothetical protein [Sinorhizobium fredii]